MFLNLNVSVKSLLFTDVFLGIMTKRISNKIVTCNEKDAPWITPRLKTAIRRNSRVYRKCVYRERIARDHDKVRKVQNATNKLIKEAKLAYYTIPGIKLSDPKLGQKHFWTAYKKIINKKKILTFLPYNCIVIYNCKQIADILQISVLSMIMAMLYRIFSLKPKLRYPIYGCRKIKLFALLITTILIKLMAVMEYLLLCLNCVLLKFNDCINSRIVGSMPMSTLYTKKITAKLKVIIDQFRCYLFVAIF